VKGKITGVQGIGLGSKLFQILYFMISVRSRAKYLRINHSWASLTQNLTSSSLKLYLKTESVNFLNAQTVNF
jgi:hypothetical protein